MKAPEPSHAERIDVRNLKSRDEIDRFTDVPFTMVSADGHAMPPTWVPYQNAAPSRRQPCHTAERARE
jgi:hypothetical protein